MAGEKKFILPEEYNGKIIVPEDYYSKRREQALQNARNRTQSYPKPSWWKDDVNGIWKDCISTATNNYGDACTVTGNDTFHSNPEKYGFRLLEEGENPLPGDIVQAYEILDGPAGRLTGRPYHGYMVNELNNDGGIRNINYSDGDGSYHVGADDWWAENDRMGGDGRRGWNRQYRYRYVGTPAEQSAIEAHNAALTPIQSPIRGVSAQPAPVSAEQVLSNGRETLRRLAAKRQVANNL